MDLARYQVETVILYLSVNKTLIKLYRGMLMSII